MATKNELGKYCRDKKLYEKAKTTLCGFSNFQVFIDGDLDLLKSQAKKEGLEFFVLKGELKSTSTPKEEII